MALEPIKIDRAMPIPNSGRSGWGKWKELIQKMRFGDSVLLDQKSAYQLYHSARNSFNIKMVIRKQGDKFRVWKTDKPLEKPIKGNWDRHIEG